jgi:hypothetical protein
MQVHLPVLGTGETTVPTDKIEPEEPTEKKEESPHEEKIDQDDDLSGELAEIIRDLTRRQPP